MERQSILIIEDEEDIRELLSFNLKQDGYEVSGVESGEEGLSLAQKNLPSLVLLDLMLPGMDGLEVCKSIKSSPSTERIPVIMISAKGEESDIVTGLQLGADDYITKPFSPNILKARVKAVLRRSADKPIEDSELCSIHELVIDPKRHEVRLAGEPIDLTATEFKILHYLARHPGWVFTRYQIVDSVKGEDYAVTERAVDVQIVGLRKKLGEFDHYIETVRGVGYRFKE